MRIVGGKYRNRRLKPPGAMEARPTTDFAKEALFNILQHSHVLDGIRVLDLFSGTGSIALEFLSRGAASVLSVERDPRLVAYQQRLASELGETGWRTLKADAFEHLRRERSTYDVVFADPPFGLEGSEKLPAMVRELGVLGEDGLFILEHPGDLELREDPWARHHRKYGTVHFSFYGPQPFPR